MKNLLKDLPFRESKPRKSGMTMVMDKGLSYREAEDLIETSGELVDIIKLGFGTAVVTGNLDKKLDVYRSAHMPVYFGGTLLEAFLIRKQFDDYLKIIEKYDMAYAEVSDGSMSLAHDEKCRLMKKTFGLCESIVGSRF